MRNLLYISTALVDPQGDELTRIVAVAQRENHARAITGLLLYNGRNFLQLLEAEAEPLAQLMDNITRDLRHTGLVRMVDRAASRTCAGWAMEPIAIGHDVVRRRNSIARALPPALAPDLREIILNFAILN